MHHATEHTLYAVMLIPAAISAVLVAVVVALWWRNEL